MVSLLHFLHVFNEKVYQIEISVYFVFTRICAIKVPYKRTFMKYEQFPVSLETRAR